MTNGSNERLDRVEANLDKVTTILVETAERQSVNDYEIARLKESIAETNRAIAETNRAVAGLGRVIIETNQTVAGLGRATVESNQMVAGLGRAIVETNQTVAGLGRAIAELTRAIDIDAENIRALARIAEAHERRLDDLEGGES